MPGKLLVVDQTASGKSYILCMIATMVGGIVLVIVPLLLLAADQMAKVRVALQCHGSIEAHHIDKIPLSLIIELIIPRMLEIGYNSNSIMFIFVSPPQLALTQVLLDVLSNANKRKR